jgi:hypothetical protein
VVQGDKVARTVVQIGASDGKFVQILRLGNAEPTGQEKVARDATGLTDGATIKLER